MTIYCIFVPNKGLLVNDLLTENIEGRGGGSVGKMPATYSWGPKFRSPAPTSKLGMVIYCLSPDPWSSPSLSFNAKPSQRWEPWDRYLILTTDFHISRTCTFKHVQTLSHTPTLTNTQRDRWSLEQLLHSPTTPEVCRLSTCSHSLPTLSSTSLSAFPHRQTDSC